MNSIELDQKKQIARTAINLLMSKEYFAFELYLANNKILLSQFLELCEDALTVPPDLTYFVPYIADALGVTPAKFWAITTKKTLSDFSDFKNQ
jgi:hypothetical protein